MGNPQHVAMVLKGADAWNAWREGLDEDPDLSGTAFAEGMDLRGYDLYGVNLGGCSLKGALLSEVALQYAALSGADCSGADLAAADLHGSDLKQASFRDANLSGAVLSGCNLLGTDFSRARLPEANFDEAYCHDPEVVVDENLSNEELAAIHRKQGTHFDQADLAKATFYKFEGYGVHFDGANLEGAWLAYAKLLYASMRGTNARQATFIKADLRYSQLDDTDFSGTEMDKADLGGTSLRRAKFDGAMLEEIELRSANLEDASFVGADMSSASLVEVNVSGTDFSGARIYGVSAWELNGEPKSQKDLRISRRGECHITTDELEVAQFLYLMYNNKKIRNVLNTIQTKSVLILGRFSPPERKEVLDEMREWLRTKNLLPIVFDFDRPDDRDYTETVQTLAGMSLFVIVDVTSPKSTPLELEATAKQFKIPFLPIIDTTVDTYPFAMLQDLQNAFHWVLPTVGYRGKEHLMANIDKLVKLAMNKHAELRGIKENQQKVLTFDDLG